VDVPLPDRAVSAMLFGKLPAHGDFVARGLDGDARVSLDAWLAAEMASARSELGDDFESRYDRCRPWLFALEDELGWMAGSIVASADSVGRRFPLVAGRVAGSAQEATGTACACEDAVRNAIELGWSADQLFSSLATLVGGEGEIPAESGWWPAGGDPIAIFEGDQPVGLVAAMIREPAEIR
jgi:type VI secretion system protein ImpM